MKLVFAVFRLSGFSGGAARRDSIWNFHVWNEVGILSNLKYSYFSLLLSQQQWVGKLCCVTAVNVFTSTTVI